MAFSQATIEDVTVSVDGGDVRIAWRSSSPAGTTYQVYVDSELRWSGATKFAVLTIAGFRHVEVGTVAAGEETKNFSPSLSTLPGVATRVLLTWAGGDWESRTLPIDGFRVYSSAVPGGAVATTTPIATVPISTQGKGVGGWGSGGWGEGGWGAGLATYSWTTGRLCPGDWSFLVVPFDEAGNEGDSTAVAATVVGAPRAPAPNSAGKRLTYTNYHVTGGNAYATLTWLAPPVC